jgi:hypothetical protein
MNPVSTHMSFAIAFCDHLQIENEIQYELPCSRQILIGVLTG